MQTPARSANGKPPRQQTKKEKQDDSIMNTNNSCIVSKRCVEKLYHGQDQGFLRYFVKKFQRRSPLISRGYWLRMRAIETVIRQFLLNDSSRPKIVVNLGCGYDTLPFNFLSGPSLCSSVKFVDVDYPQLMRRKVGTIRETPALIKVLHDIQPDENVKAPVLLASSAYLAVACNLEDIETLDSVLQSLHPNDSDVLFVGEVSLTYMQEAAAENVLRRAARYKSAHFCLLEQFLPDGQSHPFAKTMLSHFEKLNSYLRSVTRYPALQDQESRFLGNEWHKVRAESLWSLWNDLGFIDTAERARLNSVEPFDEWEEFALFASHYFVLTASTAGQTNILDIILGVKPGTSPSDLVAVDVKINRQQALNDSRPRRFAACAKLDEDHLVLHGGQGAMGREQMILSYAKAESCPRTFAVTGEAIECHTLTQLADNVLIRVGGRRSPNDAVQNCWLSQDGTISSIEPIPRPLYRHCAIRVDSNRLLIFGGKSDSQQVSNGWLLWHRDDGFRSLPLPSNQAPPALFGSCMAILSCTDTTLEGILIGGMNEFGRVVDKAWMWSFDMEQNAVHCTEIAANLHKRLESCDAFRFGASLTALQSGLIMCGGVGQSGTVAEQDELIFLDKDLQPSRAMPDWSGSRPMLVGCSMEKIENDQVVIVGGGATCFSFGTHWNTRAHIISFSDSIIDRWQISGSKEVEKNDHPLPRSKGSRSGGLKRRDAKVTNSKSTVRAKNVDRIDLGSSEDFDQVMKRSHPAIFRNLSLGSCASSWTADYLISKCPPDLKVMVHEATTPHMSFLDKNFAYKSIGFAEFVKSIDSSTDPAAMYLRSISLTGASSTPTNLADDFPFLAQDFELPPQLSRVAENIHSSPLRISGPVSMWLHYDVMANVYCQIRGKRRMVLYSPAAAATHLDFPAGQSSARTSPFAQNARDRPPAHIGRWEAHLAPGDVLYIPPFWAHAAAPPRLFEADKPPAETPTGFNDAPGESGMSVAVNVFFKSLAGEHVYAAGRDTYANRDLAAYENGRRAVGRVLDGFKALPRDARVFYLERLAHELREGARSSNHAGGE